jgi:Rrf2 family transcriptional regulator, nitric oxide-sensitive transcriptional repressor
VNIAISEAATLAIHALAYIANQNETKPISTGKVAESFGFSEAHLSKVFQRLNKSGFLRSVRGPRGGFILAKDPEDITLLDIYEAIDGPISRHGPCLLHKKECEFGDCIFGDLLESIPEQIENHFSSTTLADLAKKKS